jgi:hypothetical protein
MFGRKPKEDPDRARLEILEEIILQDRVIYILRDTVTGVEYVTGGGASCPVTPLLEPDGTPHISQ